MRNVASLLVLFSVVLAGCKREVPAPAAPQTSSAPVQTQPAPYAPVERYEPMKVPPENPMSADKARLGHQLWFDKRLSGDGKFSCYSCHLNEKGLTLGVPLGVGPFGKKLPRNSPTMWNVGYHPEWYWDGRAKTLEGQALAAWKGVNMGADPDKIVVALNAIPGYRDQFQAVFAREATPENVSQALATYMRTIISKETPWDKWQRGDTSAVSQEAQRGFEIFKRAKCDNCHSGIFFTDFQYHNVGIGMKAKEPDVGRFKVTNVERDRGAFKTPTLRDISDSGPFFHDGSVAKLDEAVRLMVKGGIDNPQLDRTNLQPANLTEDEMKALIAFLQSLNEPTTLPTPELP